ncbi:MAG: ABC transporter permease [Acidimicrobiia bacterium]
MNGTRARFIGGKFVRLVVTLLIVTFMTTVLLSLTPGDPAAVMAGEINDPEVIAAINKEYGFTRPIHERYMDWLGNALNGDLGTSYFSKQPVVDAIKERLPVTLELAILSTFIALVCAIPLAVACAKRPNSRFDRTVSGVTFAQVSLPSFVIALFLVYLFAVTFQIFPVLGYTPLSESVSENLRSIALPVISIAIGEMVALQRVLRADLVATTQEDYIALARAKGLSTRTIMWKHALKPSSFSLITLSGLSLARLLGGTLLVEQIFVLPGLGSYLITSINVKDLVAVQGVVTFIAIVFLVVNFFVDIMYGVLDPRTRTARAVA